MNRDQLRELKELQKENERLRKAVADLTIGPLHGGRSVRDNPLVKEKSPGAFYIKGRAWLNFHEDPEGIFADIRPGDEWTRFRLFKQDEKSRLMTIIAGT
jgi:hypothetical protein